MTPFALLLAAATAASPLATRTWSAEALPAGATLVAGEGQASVRVVNPGPGPLRATLAVFRGPALSTPTWSVRGRVRTEGVAGQGLLEMWSTFPDGRSFFSRTLSPEGPMRSLEGTQGWRDFALPFQSEPGHPAPVALTVNVVLPGAGVVEVGPLELHQHDSPASLFPGAGGWFTGSQAGAAGGIAGGLLGVLGAAIGWLSARGRGRAFVLGALRVMLGCGVAALAAAVLGALAGQPREVWLSLAAIGLVSALVPALALRSTAARYRDLELRRMRAIDA
ncbi:MAG TPA: hypothetical protein VFI16_09215 [Anaeromyxobacteraceae bacterium]|nr:hypothetical protein [Anaeromyxobacteraceae bacterium]